MTSSVRRETDNVIRQERHRQLVKFHLLDPATLRNVPPRVDLRSNAEYFEDCPSFEFIRGFSCRD